MRIDTNIMIPITEVKQNFSKVAFDVEVFEISKKLLAQNKKAYEMLKSDTQMENIVDSLTGIISDNPMELEDYRAERLERYIN